MQLYQQHTKDEERGAATYVVQPRRWKIDGWEIKTADSLDHGENSFLPLRMKKHIFLIFGGEKINRRNKHTTTTADIHRDRPEGRKQEEWLW